MQQRINPDIDIIAYIINEVLNVKPEDSFCKSLLNQYIERGGLSKKQLEGLHGKAIRIPGIHPGRLATLEAIIKKKHVTYRSEITVLPKHKEKDSRAAEMIEEILRSFPSHKRVLLFKSNYDKEGSLPKAENDELHKFYRLLVGRKDKEDYPN